MENQKSSQHLQPEKDHHHEQEGEDAQQHQKHQEEEEDDQQQQQQKKHSNLEQLNEEEEEKQPHLEQLNHLQHQEPQIQHLEDQKQPHRQEEETENKQNRRVPQLPISKWSTPPRNIAKAQSPPSDHSPVDSPHSSENSSLSHGFSPPHPTSIPSDTTSKPPVVTVSRSEFITSRYEATTNTVEVEEQTEKVSSATRKRLRPDLSILRRTKRDNIMKKALLGFRISGFAFCLVSFSVLAADRNQGWALDSFHRYKEFRFCMAVNVIGFAYSGIQAFDLVYQLTAGRQKLRTRLRCYLDFLLDQILAYLLMSASSSAAVRVDDWQANWGKDKFPEMARASMALSLVAFISLALSSLVSGYTLCTSNSV